ncbi:MAG: hypothetical protein V3U98_06925 [Acidobacteriota bacterium]
MSFYRALLLAGLMGWASLPALPSESKAPEAKPSGKAQTQTAPSKQPAVPIHPLLGQTSFVVDPRELVGSGPLAEQVGPITVTLNYYQDLPGLDLNKLSPERRKRVIERANREPCTCGCRGDTVARCLVNDPNCKFVKSLAEQIYQEERIRPLTPPSKP